MEGTVYLDNIVIRKASGGSVGQETVLEKTQEEKRQIIGGAMESWISQVVGRSKNFVKTWFVLNDPLDDTNPTQLRSGSNGGQGANDFYWQDYLGKDYAPQAFKLAAQYGNPDDLLFINESNLESNIGKCIALIDLVGYIESNGGRVDGIGAKMHIDINADKQKIAEMFSLLAASGKKIKVSELFVALGAPASAAGPEHFEAQAEMYKYVASQYRSKIPASQQAGITLRSPLDHPANATWRPGEPLGLWNTNFNRKSAYAAFAEGLGNSQ
jgi:GH35 family endo-1,4-beta-xylanase